MAPEVQLQCGDVPPKRRPPVTSPPLPQWRSACLSLPPCLDEPATTSAALSQHFPLPLLPPLFPAYLFSSSNSNNSWPTRTYKPLFLAPFNCPLLLHCLLPSLPNLDSTGLHCVTPCVYLQLPQPTLPSPYLAGEALSLVQTFTPCLPRSNETGLKETIMLTGLPSVVITDLTWAPSAAWEPIRFSQSMHLPRTMSPVLFSLHQHLLFLLQNSQLIISLPTWLRKSELSRKEFEQVTTITSTNVRHFPTHCSGSTVYLESKPTPPLRTSPTPTCLSKHIALAPIFLSIESVQTRCCFFPVKNTTSSHFTSKSNSTYFLFP